MHINMQMYIHEYVSPQPTVVLYKHHPIIRVGAGLIQFVYGSHLCMAADLTLDKNLFSQPFSRVTYTRNCHEKTDWLFVGCTAL